MNPGLPSGGTSSPDPLKDATPHRTREAFRRFASRVSAVAGSPVAFLAAVATIVVWAALGPRYHYDDTWQLVINTGTTIVTFLMVFLIQNAQNRDARAIHLKLDELIKSSRGARNLLVNLERCSEDELDDLEREFQRLRDKAARRGRTPAGHAEGVGNGVSKGNGARGPSDAVRR